jgi:hypothetical protein
MGRGLDGYFSLRRKRIARSAAICAVFRARRRRRRGHIARPARRRALTVFGGYSEGETPLPIPNREVKPLSADGTWPARARESRSPPVLIRAAPTGRLVLCGDGQALRGRAWFQGLPARAPAPRQCSSTHGSSTSPGSGCPWKETTRAPGGRPSRDSRL